MFAQFVEEVELERNIVRQSLHAAERHTPKKNRCLYRSTDHHAIGNDLATSESEADEEESQKQFHEHSHNIHRASAEIEEQRIHRKQAEKEARLLQFQAEVRKRVQRLQRIKKQQQLEKSYKAVELERNIVRQSLHAAERHTPKKNRCLYRSTDHHAIGNDLATSESEADEEESQKQFHEHSHNIHRVISRARRNLADKQMLLEKQTLPGGAWGMSATRDKPYYDLRDNLQSLPKAYVELVEPTEKHQQLGEDLCSEQSLQQVEGPPQATVSVTYSTNLDRKKHESAPARKVTFDTNEYIEAGQGDGPSETRRQGKILSQKLQVPNVNPGRGQEEDKRLMKNQFSMYRRLFMDIEREQVRETIRRKQHREKINRIKKEKELKRKQEEDMARAAVESRNPITGETEEEAKERQREEELHIKEIMETHRKHKQKNKETERFIGALRAAMKEKVEKQGVNLPPLCACSSTLWDSSPETCANNCMFYKNPKAYAKALSSLLQSCEIV
ncbi:coiled-coil domain-containing protein 15-like [Anneissia japonica]|uniref:coiled-coil domain-containing protein 15-like n=1 Tax=Anneissia japonica TaxID=1529436 RepID=UPI001425B05C|nr:coiled-coil domain-containing protein 15-like [Anneissia japonica]